MKCLNCGKLIKNDSEVCSKSCADEYFKYVFGEDLNDHPEVKTKIDKGNNRVLAKGGLPFDIDIVSELSKGEVEIIQYLSPNGKRRRMACFIGNELAKKAENLIISTEQTNPREVMIYLRKIGNKEENEVSQLANNFKSESSPDKILIKMIEAFLKKF